MLQNIVIQNFHLFSFVASLENWGNSSKQFFKLFYIQSSCYYYIRYQCTLAVPGKVLQSNSVITITVITNKISWLVWFSILYQKNFMATTNKNLINHGYNEQKRISDSLLMLKMAFEMKNILKYTTLVHLPFTFNFN